MTSHPDTELKWQLMMWRSTQMASYDTASDVWVALVVGRTLPQHGGRRRIPAGAGAGPGGGGRGAAVQLDPKLTLG